ncbi:hypothetical protein F7725_002767 [Dissostichus mawsoni]|uniref:Uncharacterized protein n=1 Tax=Dissostichus mawsoni TaxID=36200 RepID=A0A7J5YA96_DISMA|nr:hypothetical protein F7725_002767 [Dissostichus mawsoni]
MCLSRASYCMVPDVCELRLCKPVFGSHRVSADIIGYTWNIHLSCIQQDESLMWPHIFLLLFYNKGPTAEWTPPVYNY